MAWNLHGVAKKYTTQPLRIILTVIVYSSNFWHNFTESVCQLLFITINWYYIPVPLGVRLVCTVLYITVLPFIKNAEENATFAVYFSRQWQDTMFLSLHNFLSITLSTMRILCENIQACIYVFICVILSQLWHCWMDSRKCIWQAGCLQSLFFFITILPCNTVLAWYMLSSCACPSVCPFVHLSCASTESKRLNIESWKQCCVIAQDSSFLMPKVSA